MQVASSKARRANAVASGLTRNHAGGALRKGGANGAAAASGAKHWHERGVICCDCMLRIQVHLDNVGWDMPSI